MMGRLIDEWKEIEGFPNYEVSNTGKVRNKNTGKELSKYHRGKYGHAAISIYHDGKNKKFQVHRLVALHFVPNPENKPEVCHIDNTFDEEGFLDNSASNLMWGTHIENCAFENTRRRQSENHADVSGENNPHFGIPLSDEHKRKMMEDRGKQVLQWQYGRVVAFYESLKEAGRKTGIHWTNIRRVCDGEYQQAGGFEWTYACKPYDVEAVVKELEELEACTWKNCKWECDKQGSCLKCMVTQSIEIVERGGRNE